MFKHIHIIGSGAIGSLLAVNAQLTHSKVIRHIRGTAVESVTLLNGSSIKLETMTNYWPQSFAEESLIILPLKSYQIAHAINQYANCFPKNSAVVLLHNGMGCYQQIAHELSEHFVYLATTSQGAFKPSEIECVHTGTGKTTIGAVGINQSRSVHQAVLSCFQSWLPPTQWDLNINAALWQKLAINALINPMTAIENIANGALKDKKYLALLTRLADELAVVARAENIHLDSASILTTTLDVIKSTANNFSSMHQDVKYKRKTEIDAINGFILERAKGHDIPCPSHQAVYDKIKRLAK